MLLIRAAFLIGVAVMLMPADTQQQARFAAATGAAVERAASFCDRNAGTCAAARDHWAGFVNKAEFAAGLASRLIREQVEGAGGRQMAHPPGARNAVPAGAGRGTLTQSDMLPPWRGPAQRTGARLAGQPLGG
jgi:hypothetical protein